MPFFRKFVCLCVSVCLYGCLCVCVSVCLHGACDDFCVTGGKEGKYVYAVCRKVTGANLQVK